MGIGHCKSENVEWKLEDGNLNPQKIENLILEPIYDVRSRGAGRWRTDFRVGATPWHAKDNSRLQAGTEGHTPAREGI